ncbi:MAG: acyl-CoA dehydrogenase family protein, partial [Pseudomonadota bacterium]
DWIFALIRTDREAPKHRGISFLLIDMDDAGVDTRPIKLISGSSPFCETFFNDVKVPKHRIVGEENRGWDVAKYLLTHEREMISAGGSGRGASRALPQVLADSGTDMSDAAMRAEAMACDLEELAVTLTIERYKDQAKAGKGAGDASAMLKYAGTELNKRRHELWMSAGGSEALEWNGANGSLAPDWLRTKANSIEGGTSEVMLGIISKRVLELPG